MASLDDTIDAAFEPLRGRPGVDRTAAAVSNLADYGFVWVVVALWKARRRGPRRRRAVLALGAAGVSSLLVSRAAKAAVARQRPDEHLDANVRAPTSSSFPSGHTLAAFCTAIVLAETDAQTVAYGSFAAAVAASRVHLRAHHPTDVVGGAAIGTALGLGLRPAIDLLTPGSRRAARRGRAGRPQGMTTASYLLERL
jgi:undecaprenyl-diphosphatase